MDSIPFAFCDAVVGTIKDLPRVDVPFPDTKWNKALQDHSSNRRCFTLYAGFYDEKWSYNLLKAKFGSNALLTTVLAQVGPKYLRIDCIQCVAGEFVDTKTSKEELNVKRLKPFLNFPRLSLYAVNESTIPDGDLHEMFAKINISAFYSFSTGRNALEFAKQLMQQDTLLKEITILGARDLLADGIADYRATGRVVRIGENSDFSVYKTSLLFVR